MVIVAGLSADYKIKAGIIKNNATGLEEAEIEHVVGNQCITGFSGSSTTQRYYRHREAPLRRIAERSKGDRATVSRVTFLNCGREGHRAQD